jgi:isoleucyl-tRNA synthetase
MSSFYLDILKDRLYTFKSDSPERRGGQWVLSQILSVMAKLMAPVLSFTADEIWSFMPGKKEESVFLSAFPDVDKRFLDEGLEQKWERLIAIRDMVNKALEMKRQEKFIGNSLEAKVTLFLTDEDYALLDEYRDFLTALFIVSDVEITSLKPESEDYEDSKSIRSFKGGPDTYAPQNERVVIKVEKALGNKCERCWNWSEAVGTFEDAPELCDRCYHTLK